MTARPGPPDGGTPSCRSEVGDAPRPPAEGDDSPYLGTDLREKVTSEQALGDFTTSPRLAILKPISSAVSIGTGGPFAAEGPIVLTGGAVGSIVGQFLRLTAAQRRALLVAGAAAGMSAVFGTPVAATLFGVELLAFEFKPRSMVLIGLAAATADGIRMTMASAGLVAPQPLFPVPGHPPLGGIVLVGAAIVGLATGAGALVMTHAVYGCEDLFKKLSGRIHWMWWPMIGGLLIGLGGLVDPRALGVGYDTIHLELLGRFGVDALLVLALVKMVIWAGSLGSGTSGGILAPILMMGAALGDVLGHVLPGATPGVFALLGMAGSLSGVTRSPFTAIVFAFELTHDANSLLALLVTATVSHLVSVLVLKRSILTEKVARRGVHVMREYAVDPLEATFVREVMDTDVYTVEPELSLADLHRALPEGSPERRQRLYPVLDSEERVVGVLAWSRVLAGRGDGSTVRAQMADSFTVAHPDEIIRTVADRMAALGLGAVPVVDRVDPTRLEGLVTQFDLPKARQTLLQRGGAPSACSPCGGSARSLPESSCRTRRRRPTGAPAPGADQLARETGSPEGGCSAVRTSEGYRPESKAATKSRTVSGNLTMVQPCGRRLVTTTTLRKTSIRPTRRSAPTMAERKPVMTQLPGSRCAPLMPRVASEPATDDGLFPRDSSSALVSFLRDRLAQE